jgi:exodeoxyribonuclease VII large subunit
MALETSAEHPAALRTVANAVAGWINRLGAVWVEGQVTQISRRPGAATAFLTLRDPVAEVSVTVTCPAALLGTVSPPLADGARVVIHAKPNYYLGRGTFSLAAREIRAVGLGDLLARVERTRAALAAEGLFAAERKRALPFLPTTIGLITGRASAAERDVVENARRRWPAVQFRIEEVVVQGPGAVPEVIDALHRLERDAMVDVIVIARGGGSVEDLLPFSAEELLRAVAAVTTPVVAAIGHEQDAPLLDLVADVRASTPTDAARAVVPDIGEERRRIGGARERMRQRLWHRLDAETSRLSQLRSRPVLADPDAGLRERQEAVEAVRSRARQAINHRLARAEDDLTHTRARVRALSPAATLERGYAIVATAEPERVIVRDPDDVHPGQSLRIRVARGEFRADVTASPSVNPAP